MQLNQSKSGHNDEAFESERKRTGKFNVEHLACENHLFRENAAMMKEHDFITMTEE